MKYTHFIQKKTQNGNLITILCKSIYDCNEEYYMNVCKLVYIRKTKSFNF